MILTHLLLTITILAPNDWMQARWHVTKTPLPKDYNI